jgi:tetratricopeptide (TPR) repeat protein
MAEALLRALGVSDSEDYAPPKLVQIIRNGEIQGELSSTQRSIFIETEEGRIETDPVHWRGEGGGFPLSGSMRRLDFTREPSEGTERYFLLGGSVALGQQPVNLQIKVDWKTTRLGNNVSVIEDRLSIAGRAEALLEEQGIKAEVLNAGMIAQDSGGVRRIAAEALEYRPKGLFVYIGNNEGEGINYSMQGEELPSLPEVRSLLRESRVYRLLADRAVIAGREASKPPERLHGGTSEVLGRMVRTQWRAEGRPMMEEGVPTDSVWQALHSRLESNIRIIVEQAEKTGTQIYLIAAPPHLGYEPMYDANDPSLLENEIFRYSGHMERASQASRRGDWEEARAQLVEAIRIDRTHAASWHQLGLALEKLGRNPEAWKALEQALLLDLSRKRSLPSYSDLAGRLCEELGCRALDLMPKLEEDFTEQGLEVYDRRWGDHEHLTPEGCDWVARAFAELAAEQR